MSTLEAALRAIVAELGSRRVRCALVGGFAVSARAEVRTTRDVDLLFASSGIEPEIAAALDGALADLAQSVRATAAVGIVALGEGPPCEGCVSRLTLHFGPLPGSGSYP